MQRKIIASIAVVTALSNRHDDNTIGFDRRNLILFMEDLNRKVDSHKNDEAPARDLVSTFDVDGPCLVAIPHNGDWEILPRPGLRSMSVCWVVELVTRAKELGGERSERDHPGSSLPGSEWLERKGSMVEDEVEGNGLRGQRDDSSTLATRSAGHPESLARQSALGEDDKAPLEERGGEHEPLYRVLNKVRGLWQLIDHPIERYTFI
jgi:hypothetical protein